MLRPQRPLGSDWPRELAAVLKSLTGVQWTVTTSDDAGEPSLLEQEQIAEEQVRSEVLEDERVRAVLDAFPGRRAGNPIRQPRVHDMPSLEEIMKMAQDVQAEMEKAQANLDTIEVEGVSGGGLVKVRASAKGRIIGVTIDDSLLVPAEKSMLEDLIAAALNDAKAKADAAAAPELQKMTSGIPLPPGFKLPF